MNRKNNNIKVIALVCVLVLLAVGVIFSIVKVTGVDKTKTIGSSFLDWQVGCLDEDGDVDSEINAIMTKKHLSLDGLKIEVQKKPGVEVYVAIFNKKGEPLNVTFGGDDIDCYEIETSQTEKTEWTYADYIEDHSDIAASKPAYAIVILVPINDDVQMTTANMRDYAKQVSISYNR